MGYKLSFNTLNGGKGTLGLMKNWAFNNSMCDGLCIKQRVPPKLIDVGISFYNYYVDTYINGESARFETGLKRVELSAPVDEYITISYKGYEIKYVGAVGIETKIEVSGTCIIPPSKGYIETSDMFGDAVNLTMLIIYANKRAVYYSENEAELAEFKNKYYGEYVRKVEEIEGTGNDITGYPFKSLAESTYVFPLCKSKPIIESDGDELLSLYLPAYRYNGEIYYPMIKITNEKNDSLNKVVGYLPDNIADQIIEEAGLDKEDVVAEDTGDSSGFDVGDFDLPELPVPDGIEFPKLETTKVEETTKELQQNVEDTAIKETQTAETKKTEVVNEETGETEEVEETTIFQTVKVKVKSNIWQPLKLGFKTLTGKFKNLSTDARLIRDKDGNFIDQLVILVDRDTGEYIAFTKNGTQGDVYLTDGEGFIFVTEDGMYISDENGFRQYDKTREETQYQYNPETGQVEEKKYDVYDDGSGVETWVEDGFWDESPSGDGGGSESGGE